MPWFQENLHLTVRYLVPPTSSRIPITLATAPYILTALVLHLLLAYLARRPGTRVMRAALFPFVFAATLRSAFAYEWTHVELNAYNWGASLAGLLYAFKAIEFGLAPNGILKVEETKPGVVRTSGIDADAMTGRKIANGTLPLLDARPAAEKRRQPTRPSWPRNVTDDVVVGLRDGIEALCALRGIGWEAGTGSGIYIPKDTRDTAHPGRFFQQTLRAFAFWFLVTDFLESCVKLVPGLGTPAGGSMFAFGSNIFEKYLISTMIHVITGFSILGGFNMVYSLVTLLAVAIFQHHPTSWPPIFDSPWASTSLHDFWSRKWHQLLRQTFLVMGGYPFQRIFGTPGLIFGTFLASGIYHEWALYAMGRGLDIYCVTFFTLQPVGIMLERLFRRWTGYRVDGWPGLIWTWAWIGVGGQLCIDSWHRHGFAGGIIIPAVLSPTRLILFPLLARVVERFTR